MSDQIIISIIAAIPPTLVAFVSAIISLKNSAKIEQVHVLVNSRFDEWMAATKKASFAEGAKSETDKK